MRVYFPICLLKCLITPAKHAMKKLHVSKMCYVRLHVKADIAHILPIPQKQIGESLLIRFSVMLYDVSNGDSIHCNHCVNGNATHSLNKLKVNACTKNNVFT